MAQGANQVLNLFVNFLPTANGLGNFFAQDFPMPAAQTVNGALDRLLSQAQWRAELRVGECSVFAGLHLLEQIEQQPLAAVDVFLAQPILGLFP